MLIPFLPVNPHELAMYARSIQRKYINADAEMCLTLPEAVKNEIDRAIEEGGDMVSREVFSPAQALVYTTLSQDIFPRFFYSFAGKKYLAKVLEEEKRGSSAGIMRITAGSTRAPPEKPPRARRFRRLFRFRSAQQHPTLFSLSYIAA